MSLCVGFVGSLLVGNDHEGDVDQGGNGQADDLDHHTLPAVADQGAEQHSGTGGKRGAEKGGEGILHGTD